MMTFYSRIVWENCFHSDVCKIFARAAYCSNTFADVRLTQECRFYVEETVDFQQLPRRILLQEVSRQCWSVAILYFLTSPFPFEPGVLLKSGK